MILVSCFFTGSHRASGLLAANLVVWDSVNMIKISCNECLVPSNQNFFRVYFDHHRSSRVRNCEDHLYVHSLIRSSNICFHIFAFTQSKLPCFFPWFYCQVLLRGDYKKDAEDVKETAIKMLSREYSNAEHQFRMVNGYRRVDPRRGAEYILDIGIKTATGNEQEIIRW